MDSSLLEIIPYFQLGNGFDVSQKLEKRMQHRAHILNGSLWHNEKLLWLMVHCVRSFSPELPCYFDLKVACCVSSGNGKRETKMRGQGGWEERGAME